MKRSDLSMAMGMEMGKWIQEPLKEQNKKDLCLPELCLPFASFAELSCLLYLGPRLNHLCLSCYSTVLAVIQVNGEELSTE